MAIMVLLEGQAKAEMVTLKATLPKLFPDTRAYEGCRGITAYINSYDSHTFVFVEYWKTKALYERYLAWRTETGVIAGLVSMSEAPPSIRYFDQIDA
jgi:quinol monooxygenase YgiN